MFITEMLEVVRMRRFERPRFVIYDFDGKGRRVYSWMFQFGWFRIIRWRDA